MEMLEKENNGDFMPNPLQPSGPLMGPGWLVEEAVVRPRILRLIVTDADATDSSSDEDDRRNGKVRGKRFVREVNMDGCSSRDVSDVTKRRERERETVKKRCEEERKFRGVRQRVWGKWCAEIRDGKAGIRHWLGTYDTAEEAAMIYDQAAMVLHGEDAHKNFGPPPQGRMEKGPRSSGVRRRRRRNSKSCKRKGAKKAAS